MKDILNKYANLVYLKSKGKDVEKQQKELKKEYDNNPASKYDIAEAVFYMLNQFNSALQPVTVANNARYDLLVRSLEKNRVLSKDVLDSIKDQLEAIRKEEQASIVGDNED